MSTVITLLKALIVVFAFCLGLILGIALVTYKVFNKVEVNNIVDTNIDVVEEVKETIESNEESNLEEFEYEIPELNLAVWYEDTEEVYQVEENPYIEGAFGIYFNKIWCPLHNCRDEEDGIIYPVVILNEGTDKEEAVYAYTLEYIVQSGVWANLQVAA